MESIPFHSGSFFVGCNYWASHAGIRMWSDWDEQVVEDDFRRLAAANVKHLRVFPLWSDFQPLKMHCECLGMPREIRAGEALLPPTQAGQAGLDETMLQRFERFCDLAGQYELKLIVGLVTGWMSGRMFAPEMLQGHNLLTDPLAIKWETKYVRGMVRRFRNHPAIMAWDLGNECNCLGKVANAQEAYVWSAAISMAIRVEDSTRPIVSGMHSLTPDGNWRMQDQGELTDVLCTHPYPLFTPHCDTDPLNQMKSPLHSVAESLLYEGIGGKPCFVEEIGVLGPMVVCDEWAADYVRMVLFTLFAHDCRGFMWWCANEQSALTYTPYDWAAVERELGLFFADHSAKPVLEEITRFSRFVEGLPIERLPKAICDAVCIIPRIADPWAAAYGAFILAKQAGLNIRFAWVDGDIPESDAYILPSLEGQGCISLHTQRLLMERVRNGATLVVGMDGAILSPFAEMTGMRILSRAHNPQKISVQCGDQTIEMQRQYRMKAERCGADVLLCDENGDPILTQYALGSGKVLTVFAPLEVNMAVTPGIVDSETAQPYHLLYRAMGLRSDAHVACVDLPTVGLTEHIVDDRTRHLIVVNYEPYAQTAKLKLHSGWAIESCVCETGKAHSTDVGVEIAANSGVFVTIRYDD